MIEPAIGRLLLLIAVAVVAFVLSLALIVLSRPWLERHALAQPNARSSHRKPTPQGGGGAVVIATLAAVGGAIALSPALQHEYGVEYLTLAAAAVLLAVVGAVDDMRSLPASLRLALQCLAVAAVIAALPSELQVLPQLPRWLERAGLFFGGVWLVNLVNFMDGIDWMTVAEFVPLTGAIVLVGVAGAIEPLPALAAAALLGAVVGFAPFNKPAARLFLGDVGSLPIGLLLGWLLLRLAGQGHLAAALILPLYYLADATLTLARRLAKGERVWQAHRMHFYQRATDNGFSMTEVVARVFAANVALAALALLTVATHDLAVSAAALALAAAIVAWLLLTLARGRR